MNAYELADEIDNFLKEEEQLPWGTKQVYLDMASTMIRQQAKRIEELESSIKVNQEPVAWMSPDSKLSKTEGKLFHIPLYTAPQYRELSREEVRNVWLSLPYDPDNAPYLFAHAILKKASEK